MAAAADFAMSIAIASGLVIANALATPVLMPCRKQNAMRQQCKNECALVFVHIRLCVSVCACMFACECIVVHLGVCVCSLAGPRAYAVARVYTSV